MNRISLALGAIAAIAAAGCAGPTSRSAPVACADLPAAVAALKNVRITAAAAVADDGKGTPAHCQVAGVANERTGSDGRRYAIAFEMRLSQGRVCIKMSVKSADTSSCARFLV